MSLDSLTTLSSEAWRRCGFFCRFKGTVDGAAPVLEHCGSNAVRALLFAASGKTKDQAEVELSMLRKFDFLCPEELKPKLKTALGEQGKAKAKAKGKAGAKKQDMEQAEVDALSVFS